MTRLLLAFAPALLVLSATLSSAADTTLSVENPRVFETPPNAAAAAGYADLSNSGEDADRLISASSDIAMVQFHRSVTGDDGVARMEHQMDGIEIPAGGDVALQPGGLHLMLMQLERPLAAGDVVPVTLVFEGAGAMVVEFPVVTRRSGAGGHSGHGSQTHGQSDHSGHGSGN